MLVIADTPEVKERMTLSCCEVNVREVSEMPILAKQFPVSAQETHLRWRVRVL